MFHFDLEEDQQVVYKKLERESTLNPLEHEMEMNKQIKETNRWEKNRLGGTGIQLRPVNCDKVKNLIKKKKECFKEIYFWIYREKNNLSLGKYGGERSLISNIKLI